MIEVVQETASTNADLVRRLGAGEHVPEGTWLRAIRQNAGRGRRGREWLAPEGNLTCSTVVGLLVGDPLVHTVAFVAALAVHDVVAGELEERGPVSGTADRCILKWPNDVLVDGAKICGVLLERVGDHVVAGIGINVDSAPEVPGRATTSLRAAGGTSDAAALLELLAGHFTVRLMQWRTEGLAAVLTDWQHRAYPVGTPLRVTLDDAGTVQGAFAGLDPDGALRLRLADGSLRVIHAGDVSLV